MGVPSDIGDWFTLIYGTIVRQIIEFRDAVNEDPEEGLEYIETDEEEEVESHTTVVHVDNFDDDIRQTIPEENGLKLRSLDLSIGVTFLPVDEFSLDLFSGLYSDVKAVMRKGYLFGATLEIEVYVPDEILETKTDVEVDALLRRFGITSKMTQYLSHELTHAYEFFRRMESGKHVSPERVLNFLVFINQQDDLAKLSPDWRRFLDLVYLSLSYEINARISQLSYFLSYKKVRTAAEFETWLKSSTVYKELYGLKEFNAQKFVERFSLGQNSRKLLREIVEEGVVDRRGKESLENVALRILIGKWDRHIPDVNREFTEYGVEVPRVSTAAKENPSLFLSQYEKRFHLKWEDFIRRAHRLWGHFDSLPIKPEGEENPD